MFGSSSRHPIRRFAEIAGIECGCNNRHRSAKTDRMSHGWRECSSVRTSSDLRHFDGEQAFLQQWWSESAIISASRLPCDAGVDGGFAVPATGSSPDASCRQHALPAQFTTTTKRPLPGGRSSRAATFAPPDGGSTARSG